MKSARTLAFLLTTLIAIGSFVVSFVALTDLAAHHGLPQPLDAVWALIVDMTIIAATIARIAMPDSRFALCMLTASAIISLTGNAIHATTFGPIGIGIAAIPPIALLACVHLCVQLGKVTTPSPVTTAAHTPTPGRPGWLPKAGDAITDIAALWPGRTADASPSVDQSTIGVG